MNSAELPTQSFILKFWLEEDSDSSSWRGHVTHVPSGERRYVVTMEGVAAFITPYLVEMGLARRSCE